MNYKTANSASGAALGLLIASVIFAGLAVVVKVAVAVPDIDADRADARSQALVEIRTNETACLANVGWADEARGLVRLPIDSAIRLAAQKWQNPSAARADLNARAEAAAAPAPAAAPKPSAFE